MAAGRGRGRSATWEDAWKMNDHFGSFHFYIALIITICAVILGLAQYCKNPKPTVHEILPKHGLPNGLLPDSVSKDTLYQDGKLRFDVDEIKVDLPPHVIYFTVEINKKLDVDQFLTAHLCKR